MKISWRMWCASVALILVAPAQAKARSGSCVLSNSQVRSATVCSFEAGSSVAVVVGLTLHADTVIPDLIGDGSRAEVESGAEDNTLTLEGPGVSESWGRNTRIGQVLTVQPGEVYLVRLNGPGVVSVSSGPSPADIAYASGGEVEPIGDTLGAVYDQDHGEMTLYGCFLGAHLRGSSDSRVHYGAMSKCLEPMPEMSITSNLLRRGATPGWIFRAGVDDYCVVHPTSGHNADACTPAGALVVKDSVPCPNCYEYTYVRSENIYRFWLPSGGFWLDFDERHCTNNDFIPELLLCKFHLERNLATGDLSVV